MFGGMEFGVLISPFAAGMVYDFAGYLAVFAMIVGVIGFDLILRLFMVEKKKADEYWAENSQYTIRYSIVEEESESSESDSYYTGSSNDSIETESESEEPTTPPTSWPNETSPLFGRHTEEPGPWVSQTLAKMGVLLSSRRLVAALYGSFTHILLLTCFDAILPHHVKRTFGWGSSGAGALFLAVSCPCILSPLFGSLSDRYGTRVTSLTGFAIATPGFVLLGQASDSSIVDQVVLCLFLVIIGEFSLFCARMY